MKLFMITDYFRPSIGGLENSTAYLAKALQRRFPLEILTVAPATPFQEDTSLPVRRFSTHSGAPYAAMKAHIASYPAPRAACFFGFSDEWTDSHLDFLACARHELVEKVIFKVPSLNEFSLYINDTERKERFLAADYIICPNPAIRAELVQAGIPAHKTIYQPNGVPCNRFIPASHACKQALREASRIAGELVFIFTGRFAARKRVGMLVEAFKRVPEAALVLVGYFDNRFDQGSAFEVPENGNVYLFGPTRDILPYLQAADVFISASLAEGMPNSLLEALACGLPALVTAIPGHLEVIKPGLNGQVFAPDSLQDLCAQIGWFIQHRAKLPSLSSSARATILSRFNIEFVAHTYHYLLTGDVT